MQRVGLAGRLIGSARAVEHALEFHRAQHFVEPAARLAGRHRKQVAARLQRVEQGQHAVKQAQVVVMRGVMVAVALTELGVFFRRHVGRGMGQRLHQAQADHIAGFLVGRHRAAHVAHRGLDAAHDDFGRIKQRAVPVKGNQVEISGLHIALLSPGRSLCAHGQK
jgi:hypothetical protein